MKTCCFCGHSLVYETIREPLCKAIAELIENDGVDCFYVGNHGGFDNMVYGELRKLKKVYPQITFYVVLAYMPGKKDECSITDPPNTIYPDGLECMPPRFAIKYRNRWMVDQSDYLIAYVSHGYGGSAQTLRYAQQKKLAILNLASL